MKFKLAIALLSVFSVEMLYSGDSGAKQPLENLPKEGGYEKFISDKNEKGKHDSSKSVVQASRLHVNCGAICRWTSTIFSVSMCIMESPEAFTTSERLKTGIGLPRISSLIIMLLQGSRLRYCGANGAEKVSGVFLICV